MSTATIEHTVKVGDVFCSSWGYDQTNVDYAVVTKVTPKGVYIQKCTTAVEPSAGPSQDLASPSFEPVKGDWTKDGTYDPEYVAPPKFHRVQSYTPSWDDGTPVVHLHRNSYSSWSQWNGKPQYQTAAGWGH